MPSSEGQLLIILGYIIFNLNYTWLAFYQLFSMAVFPLTRHELIQIRCLHSLIYNVVALGYIIELKIQTRRL